MRRGEVWWAELRPRSGSEPRGDRPVIIVSHDGFNRTPSWQSIIVVPLSTSATQGRRGPTTVAIPRGAGGVARASVALCHQVTTLDREKLVRQLGALSASLLADLESGLKAALDLS